MLSDSHAHLASVAEALGPLALASLLEDYAEAGRSAPEAAPLLLDVGTEAGDLGVRLALGGRRPFLRYSLGLWPGAEALANPEESLQALGRDLREARALEFAAAGPGSRGRGSLVAALGEGGLDYHHDEGSREAQRRLFEGQLDLAAEEGLPFIVHSRDAFEDSLSLVSGRAATQVVIIHCFGYGPREAEAFLEAGCLLSFAGNLTYKSAGALREALVLVPRGRLLLETDAPYLNPMPHRGRPASPRDIGRTYEAAADLLGLPSADLAAEVRSLMVRLFFRS